MGKKLSSLPSQQERLAQLFAGGSLKNQVDDWHRQLDCSARASLSSKSEKELGIKKEDATIETKSTEDEEEEANSTISRVAGLRISTAASLKNENGNKSLLKMWLCDVKAVARCQELSSSFTNSTLFLATLASGKVAKTLFLPITIPCGLVTFATVHAYHAASDLTSFTLRHISATRSRLHRRQSKSDASSEQSQHIFDTAAKMAPLIARNVVRVKNDIGYTLLKFLGWQCAGECTSEQGPIPYMHQECDIDYNDLREKQYVVARDSPNDENEDASNNIEADRTEKPLHTSFLRVCDLEIHISTLEGSKDTCWQKGETLMRIGDPALTSFTKKVAFLELRHDALTAQALNSLIQTGVALSSSSESHQLCQQIHQMNNIPSPVWQPVGSSAKLLKKHNAANAKELLPILQREVLLWTGKMESVDTNYYGRSIPLFKARGIVDMSPLKFAELLLDNNRVRLYNRWSLCRNDELVLQTGVDTYSCDKHGATILGGGETKVVYSETKIPLTGMVVALKTLMHGRKLFPMEDANGCGGYVIVSRSVNAEEEARLYQEGQMPLPARQGSQNEILWDVNIMRNVTGFQNKTDLTVVGQVNNSMVPQFLVQRIGIMGAIDFFKRVRSLS